MAGKRTEAGIARTAKRLGCDVAAVKAVIAVESNGNGFMPDGRPVILYEAHVFSRETQGRYDSAHPTLSSRTWNRGLYNLSTPWAKFYQALQLDPEAAQKACSWGLFQIMGLNWRACGEKSLAGFVHAMYHNEDAHLSLFAAFVETQGLADDLRRLDWANFARVYNGPSYKTNAYDTRLASAYAREKAGA